MDTPSRKGGVVSLGPVIGYIFGSLAMLFTIPVIIMSVVHGLKLMIGKFHIIKQYHSTIDRVLFAQVFSILGIEGNLLIRKEVANPLYNFSTLGRESIFEFLKTLQVKKNTISTISTEILQVLASSELITEAHNTNQVDTELEIVKGSITLTVAELDIEHVTGSGKNQSVKQIFHGYFARCKLGKELTGKTFVSTEGDTNGFGQVSFWNKGNAGIPKETILEWNDFENMLHVATTNETEARYVLTPDFMQDLYDWWKEHKTNIRVSFIKDSLYILFPDEQVRINTTVNNLTEERLVEYVYTIARPLWHILRLIEKVKL